MVARSEGRHDLILRCPAWPRLRAGRAGDGCLFASLTHPGLSFAHSPALQVVVRKARRVVVLRFDGRALVNRSALAGALAALAAQRLLAGKRGIPRANSLMACGARR